MMSRGLNTRLTAISPQAMHKAISEFDRLGRTRFLQRYGVYRSSKYYLIHDQRIYDTKALVAAAYRYQTRKNLRSKEFGGGPQTKAVFEKLAKASPDFAQTRFFEDSLGELRYLATEYDRLPRASSSFRELGFSKWIPVEQYGELKTGWLPGVYAIAASTAQPNKMAITDQRVVYIGETVTQTLRKRLHQFNCAIEGRGGHGGGDKLRGLGHRTVECLWFCIRSFCLPHGFEDKFAAAFRSSQIRYLERRLLYEYVLARGGYPSGNIK
jgi:hypothetical protein